MNCPIKKNKTIKISQNTKNILSLSHTKAREVFIQHESYCNFDLPPYIQFNTVLYNISQSLKNKKLTDFYEDGKKPEKIDSINHVIFHSKDGKYAWRPICLIHPALYVSLVHNITKKDKDKKKKTKKEWYATQIKRLAICMADFVYMTKFREHKIEDVIETKDSEFFKTVTGISKDDFSDLCDKGFINREELNRIVLKFRLKEESSLKPEEYIFEHINDKKSA